MSKEQHTDSTSWLSADEVLVEAARNGDTSAVRVGLEKLSPDTDSKTVAFDAVHEACKRNHDECLTLLLPYVETTQIGFGMLLSGCIHADHTACTEILLQHWKSVCNVAMVPHGQEDNRRLIQRVLSKRDRACPAMWADPAVCQVLIDAGADIETKDDMGRSPLHWSCCSGALAVAQILVKAGAEVCVTCNYGNTCLTLAAHHGHTETVRYLVGLPEVDVNHEDNDGSTAVHSADVVRVLIDAGADIDTTDNDGRSSLLVASQRGHLRVVQVLLRAGADVCVTDDEGDTCLTLAANFGCTETVRTLLCMPEVDVNQSNNSGFTPLHRAVLEQHADVVQVLIDAGADIGQTGPHYACFGSNQEIVQMLVEAGADVCVIAARKTCLIIAACRGNTEIVRYLLGLKEVDVNQRDLFGMTALHYARQKQHAGVVQVLLEHGAEE